MAKEVLGGNITFPIYNEDGTPFNDLVLHKATYESVVMSLGDKITGDVYYKDNTLNVSLHEYIVFRNNPNDINDDDVKYILLSPPVVVREGMVADNSDLKGMTKYSFTFYHPMCKLSNMPFTDIAVSNDEKRYKSEDKKFSWIGNLVDFIAKINKNLQETEWVVELSNSVPQDIRRKMSEVMAFDSATIAESLKKIYDTWKVPFIVDSINEDEPHYASGKRFLILVGLPSNEIYEEGESTPFVFKFGKGVGLKNNSATPRNNKIITRIAGRGSENNIPYGYPQIVWEGDQSWDFTINNNGNDPLSYPIYEGIVGGELVKLIKHPFTRPYLMPSVYTTSVNKKVNPFATGYNPDIELVDYYDASDPLVYPNTIITNAPSYELHEFEDIKPELGTQTITGAYPINNDLTQADGWDDTVDGEGNYAQSYFKVQLPVLSFDLYASAAITQEMQLNMRSGACIGCTFPVQVDWDDYKLNFYDTDGNFAPDGEQRDLEKYPKSNEEAIEIIVQKEYQTFGTIMPNIYQKPSAGDEFVVLGISLPTSYITNAEQRLDEAMRSYMLANNVHYFDYPLKFDEKFLYEHTDILSQIRNNTVIRFEYAGQQLELYVKQITIKYGDAVLPQYDITLTDDVSVVLNQIGQVQADVNRLSSLLSTLRQSYGNDVWLELSKKLSRVADDIAQGKITFQKGLVSERESNFKGDVVVGNATAQTQATTTPVVKSNQFVSGMQGWYLDHLGNMEVESLTVRSYLEVMELLINRLQAQEGDTIFADNDQIESVEVETEGNTTTYLLTLKEKWDGYFTAQQEGNILKGVVNTLAAKQSGGTDYSNGYTERFNIVLNPTGNPLYSGFYELNNGEYVLTSDESVVEGKAYYRLVSSQGIDSGGNLYYTSWMYVTDVYDNVPVLDEDGEPVLDGEGNPKKTRKIRVALWSDDQVPAQRNFPPCAKMNIARWGCMLDPTDDRYTTAEKQSIIKRQRLFYISTSDGRIMKLSHVNKPILEEWNYGTTLGTIPEFMWQWQEVAEKALPTRDYLYAQGIIYQSLIHVNPQGVPIGVFVDKGVWQNNTAYLHYAWNAETGQWETHDVWWMGCKWRCLVSQPVVSGGTSTYYEPAFNSDYWTLIEGNETFTLELTSSNGEQFQEGTVATTITPRLYYGSNIEITSQIDSYNWSWKRRTSSTDGTSQADVTWNGLHSGVKNLAITDEDMPEEWSSSNKAIFTCRVGISKNNSVVYVEKDFFISHIISGRQGDPTPQYHVISYAWSSDVSTQNAQTPPTTPTNTNVDWKVYVPSAVTGYPYLWMRTQLFKWSGNYDANNNPIYNISQQDTTYSRMTGESGTGFQPKGSVAQPSDLANISSPAIGDAYMVESNGHLYIYVGGTPPNDWKDFGEIRGENGLSSYIHLAWAHAVATHSASAPNGAGVYPDDGMGFTTSKNAGQNFEYIGFLADNEVQDSQDPWKYTWKHMGGAVYLDLDNDSDTVLVSRGSIIGEVVSTGTLYVGGTAVTQGVTWSRTCSNGVSIYNYKDNLVDYTTNVIKVMNMTVNTGWVLLTATYNGVDYSAKFTLKRSFKDKYEIIPITSSVLFNQTTQSPTESVISFKIKMTDVSGYTEYVDDQQQEVEVYVEATDFDEYAGQNGVDYDSDNGVWTALVSDNAGYYSYRISVVNSVTSEIEDEEFIPIIDTRDGENAVSLNVTPPVVIAHCDDTGALAFRTQEFTINLDLRYGNESATITSITNISSPRAVQYTSDVNSKTIELTIEEADSSDIEGILSFTVHGTTASGMAIQANGRVQIGATFDGEGGQNGRDSVRLDLDNESDSMQYSSSGEQITSAVITRASLYDGNTLKTSGITWAYELDGIPAADQPNGIVVGNFSSGVQPFTIRKITQENATLTVKATYKSTTYRAIFSIKKLLNKDKYELVANPDTITFNPDEQSTPAQDLVVQINHWSPSGTYSQVDSTTTTGVGLKLYAAKVSESGTEMLGNPVALSSGKYTIPKDGNGKIDTSLSAYRFILKDGIGGNILDSETVPIAKLHSGTSIYADLSNEMDSVPMDGDGFTVGDSIVTTNVSMYYGTVQQTLSNITWPSSINSIDGLIVAKTPASGAPTGIKVTIEDGYSFPNDKVVIPLTAIAMVNGQSVNKQFDFTIQGVRAGENGESPIIYQISPRDTAIKKSKTNVFTPTALFCDVVKREGNEAPNVVDVPSGYYLYFNKDGGAWTNYNSYKTNGIPTDDVTTNIKFRLAYGTGTLARDIDIETVPLVEDGKDGSGSNAVRLDLTNEMDSIQYSGTTKVGANAQTTARLYDGAQEVPSSSVSYSILDNSYEGCSSATATQNGQVFTISGIASNATQARITIKAVYTKNNVSNTYYATFTVKKLVDQPKYELEVTPNALSYNKDDDEYNTNPTIKIKVKKTDINGNVSYPSTLQSEGLYLYMGGWNGIGYTTLVGTTYLAISNYSYDVQTQIEQSTYSDYYIELRKTNSSGELLDHENVPVTTVQNGGAGAAIKAEYSPTNTAQSGHDEFQEGDIYMRTKIDKVGEDWSDWVRIVGESGGETDYKFNISNRATSTSASVAPPASTFLYRKSGGTEIDWKDAPMATTNDYQYLWAQVQKMNGNGSPNGSPYYIRLTGEAGPAGTTYEIRSTMGEVVIGESSDTATLNTTVSLYQSIGLNPATNLQAYFTWYRRIGSTFYKLGYSSQIGSTFQITVTSIRTSSADDIVVFARTSGAYTSTYAPTQSIPTDYLAKLEIPVRKQGGQGPTGPEGPSGKNAVRINIDNQADLISCYSDGKVRYARTVVTEVTIYDGAEYATTNVGIVTSSSSLAIGGCSVSRANITSNGVIVGCRFTWNFTTGHTISQAVSKDIVLSYNGVEYSTSFSLVPTNSSAIYQLAPEPTSISFARASNGIDFASPTTVYVKLHARKIEGANSSLITTPTIGNAEGLSIMWKRVGVDSSFTGSEIGANNDTGVDIPANSNCTSLALQLYKDNVLVDEEDISVMRAGKDGAATSYRIVVTSSSASINASGQLGVNITWRVKRNTGGEDYDVSLNNSNSFYKLNTASSWTGVGTSSSSDTRTLTFNTQPSKPFPTSISLLYGTSSNPLATTEIPITIMGQMGRNFYYAGIWSASVEYTLTDFSAPFVILRETGQPDFYYVMQGENRTISGNASKPSNTNTDWHEMETSFKYLITEAMFTNFAKLGASIFNEDYMFSQYGYMAGYDGVREKIKTDAQYQYADAGDMDAIGNITTIKGENKTNYHLSPNAPYSLSRQPLTDIELQSGRYYTVQVDATCGNGSNANNVKIDIKNRDTSNIIYSKTFTLQNAESKNLCFVFECTANAWYNIVTTASATTTNGLIDVQLYYVSIGVAKFTPSLHINLRTGQMVANDLTARGMLYASSVGYSHITGTTNNEILYVGEESFVVLKDVFQSVNGQAKVVLPAPSDCKGRVIEVFGYAGSSQETFYMTWVGAASTAAFGLPWGGTGHAVNTQFTKTTTYIKLYSDGTIWRIMKQE